MAPAPLSAGFQSLPLLPTIKLGPSGAGSRVSGLYISILLFNCHVSRRDANLILSFCRKPFAILEVQEVEWSFV